MTDYDDYALAQVKVENGSLICQECRVDLAGPLEGYTLADLAGIADDHTDDCQGDGTDD